MSVPEISQISVYPIKSIAGVSLQQSQVEAAGLAFDRRFVVSDRHGRFITMRTEPKLGLIHARLCEQGMLLHAPGMPEILLNYARLSNRYQAVTIWQDNVSAQYCGPEFDQWFSSYLGQPCQLLYFGQRSQRNAPATEHPVSFADGYPLLLISQGALDALNQRLDKPVQMSRFRPNLVVANTEPFAEDSWQQIRIGEAEFAVHSGCSRCVVTTLAPGSSQPHPLREPLATLQSFRSNSEGEVMFGQNLLVLKQGVVSLRDKVEVLSRCDAPAYPDNSAVSTSVAQTRTPEYPGFTLLCCAIRDETHDVKTFEFEHYDGVSVAYLAGQHIAIELYINGRPVRRRYTLSSCPEQPQRVSITVKRLPEGQVSNYLHDHFRPGYILHVRKVEGHFHLDAAPELNQVLLLSAGSGITPLLSMLRSMSAQSLDNDVVFFHSARHEDDIIAFKEVKQLAAAHGNCDVQYTLTRQAQPPAGMHSGHITPAMLAAIPDLTRRQVFLCGPNTFKQHCEQLLIDLGLPAEQFHFESFGGATEPCAESTLPEVALQIRFDNNTTPISANNQASILTQCERAGMPLPCDCRAGICGECKVRLLDGEVRQLPDMGGLSQSEQEAGYILTCSSVPLSDITLAKG